MTMDGNPLACVFRRFAPSTGAVALGLMLGGVAVQPARAQSVSLTTTVGSTVSYGSLTTDGLIFTVTSCVAVISGQSVGCDGYEMTAVSTPQGAEIKIDSNGGQPLFSLAAGSTGYADMYLNFDVTRAVPNSRTRISSATLSEVGSAPTYTDAYVGESLYQYQTNTQIGSTMNTNLTTTSASMSFGAVTGLSVKKDIGLVADPAGIVTLTSVSQLFSPAPEPASLAVVLVGLAGVGVARSRRLGRARRPAGFAPVAGS